MTPLKISTLDEALDLLTPGSAVLLHSACAEPQTLVEAVVARAAAGQHNLRGLTLYTLCYRGAETPPPYADPVALTAGDLRVRTFFSVPALRDAQRAGRVEPVPVAFASLPGLIRSRKLRFGAALVQISPPNAQGLCSFGPAAALIPALLTAGVPLIAELNHRMPFVQGPLVPLSRFAAVIESDRPLLEVPTQALGEVDRRIASHVLELIPDGAKLQLGVGSVSSALFDGLRSRRDLELVGSAILDGTVDLVNAGAVDIGRPLVGSLLLGSRRLFDFASQQPSLSLDGLDVCNSPARIATLPRFISVNSAFEVDLTGQVNAEMLGRDPLAGPGSQSDYAVGTWHSPGGLYITALASQTASGRPRIVPSLDDRAVTLPRHLTQVVVTENGIADLRGRSLAERARLLQALL